jgi:hypothetical protein
MSGYASRSAERAPNIFTGTIFEIYPDEATVDIKVDFPDNRFYSGVPYASAFKDKGLAGFDFVPTRGCIVLLIEHAHHDSGAPSALPMVIGFMSPPGKSIGARRDLLPSDVQVQGKYGNQLLLRSNGDAYLVGDTQNLIAFILGEELTKLRTANYVHEHPGGGVRWVVDSGAVGGAVAYLHDIKRLASDSDPYLSVSAGSTAAGGIDLTMFDSSGRDGSDNPLFINNVPAGCAFRFNVDSDGNTAVCSTGDISVEATGVIGARSLTGISLGAPQLVFESGVGGMSASGGVGSPISIHAPDGIEIITPFLRIVQDDSNLVHSDNTDESKQLLNVELLTWLQHHKHLVKVEPAPTSPAQLSTVALGTDVASTNALIAALKAAVDIAAAGVPAALEVQQAIQDTETNYTIDDDAVRTTETKAR